MDKGVTQRTTQPTNINSQYSMDPDSFFFVEEFLFPECGGVTGTRSVPCPYCQSQWELSVDEGNCQELYTCSHCGKLFSVDWVAQTITGGEPDEETEQADELLSSAATAFRTPSESGNLIMRLPFEHNDALERTLGVTLRGVTVELDQQYGMVYVRGELVTDTKPLKDLRLVAAVYNDQNEVLGTESQEISADALASVEPFAIGIGVSRSHGLPNRARLLIKNG